jgi:hypothetical protein
LRETNHGSEDLGRGGEDGVVADRDFCVDLGGGRRSGARWQSIGREMLTVNWGDEGIEGEYTCASNRFFDFAVA